MMQSRFFQSRLLLILFTSPLMLATACADMPSEAVFSPQGPAGQSIARSAQQHGVPAELMVAIAQVEGGLKLPPVREVDEDDLISVAGRLELRRGFYNSLSRGAELSGRSELELMADTDLGTEAGARVLDDLARSQGISKRNNWETWASVVETLSGYRSEHDRVEYRARVFKLLAKGGKFQAHGGETLVLPPQSDIPVWLTMTPPLAYPLDVTDYQGPKGPASVIWFDTPSTSKWTPGREAPVSMIAIHDTEGGWDASVATLQNDPNKSCHYIVDDDGSRVGQFVHEADTAWHAGNWYYNSRMVGIEHVGYSGVDDYQTAMYERGADLARDIADRYALPLDRLTFVAHQEIPNGNLIPKESPPCPDSPGQCVQNPEYGGAGHHTDPGVYWEWCQYMDIVGGICKCNDAYQLFNCVHDLSMMTRCDGGKLEIVHCADTCVVEPIGVNDHCTPVMDPGTGGAGGMSGSSGGTGGMNGGEAGGGGAGQGSGGAPSDPDSGGSPEEDGTCAMPSGNIAGTGSAALLMGMAGILMLARRRRR